MCVENEVTQCHAQVSDKFCRREIRFAIFVFRGFVITLFRGYELSEKMQ